MLEEEHWLRFEWRVKNAINLALSRGPIPLAYFEAVLGDAKAARRMAFRVNTRRKERSVGMR